MISTWMDNGRIVANLKDLKNWDKNPRDISKERFEHLKEQLKLGQYKPLLIKMDGTVLGGNMRLRAYKDENIDPVWVTTIEPVKVGEGYIAKVNGMKEIEKVHNSEADLFFEYVLSDNDNAGKTNPDLLANMLPEFDIEFGIYNVHFNEGDNLMDLELAGESTVETVEEEKPLSFKVVVECNDANHADQVYDALNELGYKVKRK